MIDLSAPKLVELAKKHPEVQQLVEIVESYQTDPQKIFYNELRLMSMALCKEMSGLRERGGKILTNDKDDKTFDRVRALMVDANKIFDGLRKGAGEDELPEGGRGKKDKKGSQVAV